MNDFYIFKSGLLKRESGSIVLETADEKIYLPIHQIRSVTCFGTVSFNSEVLHLLFEHGISLHIFSHKGILSGSFHPENRKAGEHIIGQVNAFQNKEQRLEICKAIQKAAFENMYSVLKYYQKYGTDLTAQIADLRQHISQIKECTAVEDLLLLEARTKKTYYSAFDRILDRSPFEFGHRSFHPPDNEVNAVMSFGYSLLYSVLSSLINSSRLIIDIPFIHSEIKKGGGLHLDLSDIYKPFLVDRLIFRLIRWKQLKPEMFETRNDGVFLNQKGKTLFISEFEKELDKIISCGRRKMSYRSILKKDLNCLADFIIQKRSLLKFYIFKW